ncbi:microbial collagenase isoform X1 [Carex rostrata]
MALKFQFHLSSSPASLSLPSLQKPLVHLPKTLTLVTPRKLCKTLRLAAVAPGVDPTNSQPLIKDEESQDVKESVAVLKEAAKTRRVPSSDILAALSKIKKSKVDPTPFFEILGGKESPGRTWMLIFTAQGQLEKGQYFPLTAIQRFDAAGKRIENGVYLGPVGNLTFEGRLSWKNKILAFIFECVRIKVGPFGPLQIDLSQDQREPGTKDPFFIWFYVDEEIAVAQGRGGGMAFWCRCRQVT